jgi:SAM-dependent methyltransferase
VAPETAGQLPLTGERTVPGIPEENYWFRRHEAAYLALLPYCVDAVVLEAGCGEGYGAELLAGVARTVCGVDYDELTVAHVAKAYPRIGAVRGNLAGLPVHGSSVDVVANLQVIEHLWDQEGFLAECRRVLRPGGRLLVTTPNRLTFSPGRETPLNPFHTRELAPSELDSMLAAAGFGVELLAGLRHGPGIDDSIIEEQVRVAVSETPWPASLLAKVSAVTVDDFVVSTEDLDSSLDLVAVARR